MGWDGINSGLKGNSEWVGVGRGRSGLGLGFQGWDFGSGIFR
jgi:hypothetical protein